MTPGSVTQSAASPPVVPWERLNVRLIPANMSLLAAPLASFGGTLLVTGGGLGLQALLTLGSILVAFLAVTGFGLMRFLTTRYRITDERIELRSGLLFRSERTLPVDRVRSIDLTANPLHRIFGLTSVRIGTGEQTSATGRRLTLDGVGKTQAAELRRRLLSRRDAATGWPADEDGPIAAMDWSWVRYGPLTIWGVGGLLAAVGTAYRTLHEMKIDPLRFGFVKAVEQSYGSVPLWFGLLGTVLIIVVLGAVVSTATLIEGWRGYRLERADGGVLRVRRGLLVTRSVTIEERRLSGVELREPMLLRWAGGARLNAVAGGLGNRDENRRRRLLSPPMPRAEVLRAAADVLAETESPTASAALRTHPRVVLRRRIGRGLIVTASAVSALAVLGVWLSSSFLYAAVICALVLLPAAVALAFTAYRALGHGLRGRYLVTRSGAFARSTVALKRADVIGWSITRSIFQRRAGLLTLGAATAAGEHCYKIRDVAVSDGLAFAEEAVPDLLTPFLQRTPS
ncbi:PH domain-containing protein [Actinoallomurus vinaceus]|uniref:PH domain-containing protein n=1 Tax=Actinoallomurus vinaceus TaxID=1080074 RepID=A0ABP8U3S7_9ACTN